MKPRRLLIAWLGLSCLAASLAAQAGGDSPRLGACARIDVALALLSPDPVAGVSDGAAPWTIAAMGNGRLSLGLESKAVKPELRLSWTTWPAVAFTLDRAWIKFRFPGLRGTFGLGRLGWGPALILNPADLLFDSTSLLASPGADEVRSGGKWLADAWISLADEAYVEAMAIVPDPQVLEAAGFSLAVPAEVSHVAGGARLVASSGGIGLELAAVVDGLEHQVKLAFSTQFHAALDWYLSARVAVPTDGIALAPEDAIVLGAGGFGVWTLGEEVNLSTRHELLLRPQQDWGTASLSGTWAVLSYHDLALSLPDALSISLRGLLSPLEPSARLGAELGWAPLQALRFTLGIAFRVGGEGSSWAWKGPGAASLSLGASTSW